MEASPHAKSLRKKQTDVENRLWRHLRNRELNGFKFRRQMPIGPYIVDFACRSAKLVVELDGSQHAEQTAKDRDRTDFLESRGYCVLRFWNNEMIENFEGVLETLTLALSQRERELAAPSSKQ